MSHTPVSLCCCLLVSYEQEQVCLQKLFDEVFNDDDGDDPPFVDSKDEHFRDNVEEFSDDTDTNQNANEIYEG